MTQKEIVQKARDYCSEWGFDEEQSISSFIEGARLMQSEIVRLENEKQELIETVNDLLTGIKGLPPLTAIAGTLEKQWTRATSVLSKHNILIDR
ncbi:MAG: hypothetical protein LBE91_19030 [Tannerella sp.]|nr:hypothetical protein [Tannerella sp.]